ncbi:MAG: SDR family NAD(P)-dependent oxidoreductase, partial [Granulosicoccus sp.]
MNDPSNSYPSLKNRSVIITGGGRGLGREMALALVGSGANVMITAAYSEDQLAEVQQAASGPGKIETIIADAGSYNDCLRVVAATQDAFGSVHCLVNNAGRGMRLVSETFTTKPCLFWETDPSHWST